MQTHLSECKTNRRQGRTQDKVCCHAEVCCKSLCHLVCWNNSSSTSDCKGTFNMTYCFTFPSEDKQRIDVELEVKQHISAEESTHALNNSTFLKCLYYDVCHVLHFTMYSILQCFSIYIFLFHKAYSLCFSFWHGQIKELQRWIIRRYPSLDRFSLLPLKTLANLKIKDSLAMSSFSFRSPSD